MNITRFLLLNLLLIFSFATIRWEYQGITGDKGPFITTNYIIYGNGNGNNVLFINKYTGKLVKLNKYNASLQWAGGEENYIYLIIGGDVYFYNGLNNLEWKIDSNLKEVQGAIADNGIFIVANKTIKLSRDGKITCSCEKGTNEPIKVKYKYYYTNEKGEILAYNEFGMELERKQADEMWKDSLTEYKNDVCYVGLSGELSCINNNWKTNIGSSIAIASYDYLYAANLLGKVYAIDPINRVTIWESDVGENIVKLRIIRLNGKTLLAVQTDSGYAIINGEDGRIISKQKEEIVGLETEGNILYVLNKKEIKAIYPDKLCSIEMPKQGTSVSNSPIDVKGTYFSSTNEQVYVSSDYSTVIAKTENNSFMAIIDSTAYNNGDIITLKCRVGNGEEQGETTVVKTESEPLTELSIEIDGTPEAGKKFKIIVKDENGFLIDGAIIEIDGKKFKSIDGKATILVDSAGTKEIRITKNGYQEYIGKIKIEGFDYGIIIILVVIIIVGAIIYKFVIKR